MQKKVPLTFNVALSCILCLIYFSILITVGTYYPLIFIFIIPILYILARQIKLEREQNRIEAQFND
jgi:Flp pilus assembly protein TadB